MGNSERNGRERLEDVSEPTQRSKTARLKTTRVRYHGEKQIPHAEFGMTIGRRRKVA